MEIRVRIVLGEEDAELSVGALSVPDGMPVTDAAFRKAFAIILREAAERIDPGPEPEPAVCDHPRLVPRMPCPECDPRDPLAAPFG